MMMINLINDAKTFGQSLFTQLSRSKQFTNTNEMLDTQLNRCLTSLDITLLGIGHMVGSGVYVLTASIAKDVAGPAIVISYIITGFASLLAALCYSEFAVRYPRAGSAYSYAYMALGEFWAFVVGWNMIMENLIGIAAISRSCSAYIDSLMNGAIHNFTSEFINDHITTNTSFHHIDVLSILIVFMFVGFLTFGVKVTSYLNNILSIVNIIVIIIVVFVGSFYADIKNWQLPGKGFMPHGWQGVFAASASCFYAYIGFDSIATSGEEAKDPQKSIPIATIISMAFATISYVSVSAVLTLMVPYDQLNGESGLPDALGKYNSAQWAKYLVICGASCGMVSVLIGTMYSLTRIVYSMADDGLLYSWMGQVNKSTQIPLKAMYFFASIGAALALFFELTTLVEMMSIGTLLAYLVVSASVIIARYKPDKNGNIHQILEEEEDVNHNEEQELSSINKSCLTKISNDNKGTIEQNSSNRTSTSTESTNDFRSENDSILRIIDFSWITKNWKIVQKFKNDLVKFKLKKYAPDMLPTICVFIMVFLIFILCSLGPHLIELSQQNGYYALIIFLLAVMLAIAFAIIAIHEQNITNLRYKVPCVPFIPTLSILFNVTMMTNLNRLTWLRLIIWLIIGFFIYFAYGIKNSTLNPESKKMKKDYRTWGSLDSDKNYLHSVQPSDQT